MPELAFESFPQFFEGGQLPNVSKSVVTWSLKTSSDENQDTLLCAILKALVLLDNRPCTSQEIANCIVNHKLVVLGGPNPSVTVSARIEQYIECFSETQPSAPLLLSKMEDQVNSANTRYYLSYSSSHQPSTHVHGSAKKRSSSLPERPNKKAKSDTIEESEIMIPSLSDDSWVTDNASSIGIELFGQNRNGFEFDTIIPIEYEISSNGSPFEESPNDSDEFIDDRTDTDSKSDLESFDSESEVEQSDFCDDMMNGDLDLDMPTNGVDSVDYIQDNGFSALLSDQEFHSDSSHSSTESGASNASPLLTPEPSPRRGSEILDGISAVQPSIFDEDFIHHWENQGFRNEPNVVGVQDPKCDYNDMLSLESLQIPELDELLGINEINLDHEKTIVSSNMDKLMANSEPISVKHSLDCRSIDQIQQVPVEPTNDSTHTIDSNLGNASAEAVQQGDEFLNLEEDLPKLPTTLVGEVKPVVFQNSNECSQPIPGPIPSSKSKSKSPKYKSRNTSGPESNPNMLISSNKSISPQIFITMLESLPFYVTTVGPAEGFANTYQLLRRYDSGYVNATTLLSVGGVESEKEQAVVLSLEIGRIRIRRRESPLFGTWIPLQRARQLAATCSLQHKLGPFLDYDLPSYFPSQLPPHIAAFNPAQVSSRLKQFMRSRAASLKPRDNYVANIGIAPRCLHPTSKSFFSGVGHQLNQILGLQSKQMKSYSALEDSTTSRRPSKGKLNTHQVDEIQAETEYPIGDGSEIDSEEFQEDISNFFDLQNTDSIPLAIEDNVDIETNGGRC